MKFLSSHMPNASRRVLIRFDHCVSSRDRRKLFFCSGSRMTRPSTERRRIVRVDRDSSENDRWSSRWDAVLPLQGHPREPTRNVDMELVDSRVYPIEACLATHGTLHRRLLDGGGEQQSSLLPARRTEVPRRVMARITPGRFEPGMPHQGSNHSQRQTSAASGRVAVESKANYRSKRNSAAC